MAKRVVAVTDVLHSGETTKSGDPLDVSKFTKEQLKSLYDGGAVRIEDVPTMEAPPIITAEVTATEPEITDTETAEEEKAPEE